MTNHPTIGLLIEQLQLFAPDTPCVGHIWVADDFDDVAPELTADEVLATIALADASLDADTSLSWYFLRHCADTILAAREEKN
ncbi:hypothetical protein [Candidatus Pantoea floridensis]|uniref:Uncharacterized protein n=1 Tax=Candidatus Pantoea floridensis TaxID=1938870 RepID=A0A286DSK8_9GAMM|nr:hypothetical protein [Pantoea floridensis]PIF06787.1 hypothetical protein BX596_5279 [Enterobacteriaceae bacterium JKS000233]SOD61667.1 hypothetical protein SAMN06273570_5239 [Pantoea floridensis]